MTGRRHIRVDVYGMFLTGFNMPLYFSSWEVELAVAVATLLPVLYLYLTWTFDHWEKKGVPYVKPTLFFGNIKDLVLGRTFEGVLFKHIYDNHQNEKFIGTFQFREPTLVVRDPDLIKDVLVKNFSSFHDRGIPQYEDHPLNQNLFSLPGPRWRALRAKLTPTFTSGKMKLMYHLMEECAEEFRRHLQEPVNQGEDLEMREVMAKFTTDIIGSCAFGLQMNSIKDSQSEFRSIGRKVFEASFASSLRRLAVNFLPPVARLFNLTFEGLDVEKFFLKAVKDTVEYREKNNVTRNDFMQLLIKLKNEGKQSQENGTARGIAATQDDINLDDGLLAAQAFVFFLAGFETSSTLMSFALYELAINPDVQARLTEEVDSVLKKHDGKVTYDVLQDMQYLDKVISESLRKYPPVSNLIRICTKPYNIPGTNINIEEDTRLVVPVFGIQNDPKYYPNPDKFDPERFSEEEKAKRHNFVYLPFGEGPRNCIGMRFGLLQAKIGLVSLLRDYQVSQSKRTVTPIRIQPNSLVTASKDGIYLNINKRY